MAAKYEYTVISSKRDEMTADFLNRIAADGWKFVQIIDRDGSFDTAVFSKRTT